MVRYQMLTEVPNITTLNMQTTVYTYVYGLVAPLVAALAVVPVLLVDFYLQTSRNNSNRAI